MIAAHRIDGMPRVLMDIAARIRNLDWLSIGEALEASGHASVASLLSPGECDALAGLYPQDSLFRSRVVMSRHGFGSGEYKYFDYPLPSNVAAVREAAYGHLVTIANAWQTRLRVAARFPSSHADYLATCHADGQRRATPLILRYGAGDYNCLHQDLYGEHVFPIQLAILLSDPLRDFTGGDFVLAEQRPRMQTRAHVVPLGKGDGIFFAVNFRPVHGSRGYYRVRVRHGVSTIRTGHRYTLGVIFHDAR